MHQGRQESIRMWAVAHLSEQLYLFVIGWIVVPKKNSFVHSFEFGVFFACLNARGPMQDQPTDHCNSSKPCDISTRSRATWVEALRLQCFQEKHACALSVNSHECSECRPVGTRAPQTCMALYAEVEAHFEVHTDLRTHVRQTQTCAHRPGS